MRRIVLALCVEFAFAACCLGIAVQFDLSGVMEKDVIWEPGGSAVKFGENPGGTQAWVVDGYNDGDEIADGLPPGRALPSTQPGLGYYMLRPYSQNNVMEFPSHGSGGNKSHYIDVPDHAYSRIGMLVASVDGDTTFSITLQYLGGYATTNSWEADDWYDAGGSLRASQHVVIGLMDRILDVSTGEIDDADHYSMFEYLVPVDSSRVLDSVTVANFPYRWPADQYRDGGVFAMNGEWNIPEPAAAMLLMLGGVLCRWRSRRRA